MYRPLFLRQTTSELQWLSGGKIGVLEIYHNPSVLYCVLSRAQSYAHLDEQFLQFSGLGFVSLCLDSLCLFTFCVILSYCIGVVLL